MDLHVAAPATVTFKLSSFEGPLDLLLHLLQKNKMDIRDIPVALILDQYIDHLNAMQQMNMELTSDFIVMAAHLILIKTRMLLPAPPSEDEEDPRAGLVESLLEYRRFKESALALRPLAETGRDLYFKPPEPRQIGPRLSYSHRPEELGAALRLALERVRQKLPPSPAAFAGVVGHPPVPVEAKVSEVLSLLTKRGSMPLRTLFSRAQSRSELVAVFLAVLELMNARRIRPLDDESDTMTLTEGNVS